ncbi:molybdate transport repressor ModE-like protein [Paraburkholderia sp. BL23I1N1]|uniref:LysR substrate-binding domain-containing protein n=1 Tax=Paraburkholderia sp. BL23I1N1 TaxID=1938802 RepID=UPI000FF3693F|nr:LysR family transcriptional regulator [Paraburkholderia sp. BL23I1N1]RKE25777.1 molybdate transport repressor ModE-like protein [Paraburkholderia sp. BL23I1N1]
MTEMSRASSEVLTSRQLASRIDRLRIRHLRLLELVANTGSLSAAAQELGISQPGATKMLQELESAFGCNLIERNTRGGHLSRAGSHALDRLRVALGELDAARAALAVRPEEPLVRVGMLPLVGVEAMPHVVASLATQQNLPRLILREATVDNLLELLLAGELDCVIGRLESREAAQSIARFNVKPLWAERIVAVASLDHPLVHGDKVPLSALQDGDWILPPPSSYTRRVFDQHFLDVGLIPPVCHIESISFHTSLPLVAGSHFVTVAPECAVRHYADRSRIRAIQTAPPFSTGHMLFITSAQNTVPPGVKLIEQALREWLGAPVT